MIAGLIAVAVGLAVAVPLILPWLVGPGLWLACLLAWIAGTRPRLDRPLGLALAAALLVWALIAAGWSPAGDHALRKAGELSLLAVPALILFSLLPGLAARMDRFNLALGLIGGLMIGSLYLIIEWLFDFPLYRLINGVPGSEPVAADRLNRGAAVLATLFFPAILLAGARSLYRVMLPGGMLLAVIALTSDSQAAMLGLALGLAVYAVCLPVRQIAPKGLAIATVFTFLVAPLLARLAAAEGLITADWLHPHFRHRVEIWDFVARRWAEQPLFGWGLGASREIPDRGEVSALLPELPHMIPLHPHNAPLQIWLELGLVGAMLAAGLLAVALWRSTGAASAAIIAALSIAATGFGLWQGWWMATLLLATLIARAGSVSASSPALEAR